MKTRSPKVFIVSIFCTLFTLLSVSSVGTFASLDDIDQLGGAYGDLIYSKAQYEEHRPEDDETVYECHHLISRSALNKWAREVRLSCGITRYNAFLIDDMDQKWAPSITMEKEDHEKTRSYWNPDRSTDEQLRKSQEYIDNQARRIIEDGDIIGVLKEEINFIQVSFGNKYDRAISEVLDYVRYLRFRHIGKSILYMRNPEHPNLHLEFPFGEY